MALPNQLMGQQQQQGQQYQPFGTARMPSASPQKGWLDSIKEFFLGTPEHTIYSSPYTQQQMGGFDQLQQSGLQNQQNPYAGFENIEQGAQDFFNQKLLPSIAERFTSSGRGALSSPDYMSQIGQGAQGLTRQLAGLKAQYGQNNQGFGLKQQQLGLTPQFQTSLQPYQQGALGDLYDVGLDTAKQAIPIGFKALRGGF